MVLRGHEGAVFTAALSPDGKYLATAGFFGVQVWDWENERERRRPVVIIRWREEAAGFTSVAFSPDGELVVTSHMYAGAQVWDARTGVLLSPMGEGGPTASLSSEATASFGPDGTSVLTADGKDARIYECAECDRDGRLLALVSGRVTPQQLLTGHSNILLDLEAEEGSAGRPMGPRRKRARRGGEKLRIR